MFDAKFLLCWLIVSVAAAPLNIASTSVVNAGTIGHPNYSKNSYDEAANVLRELGLPLAHPVRTGHLEQKPLSGERRGDTQTRAGISSMKKFPFVSKSKILNIIKQRKFSDPSTQDSPNVFVTNMCDVERKKMVTFDQAKDAIVQAWLHCEGNPLCQLMQILGGIDNTLELQDRLVDQITFLNKLFIIQRKLIKDIFDQNETKWTTIGGLRQINKQKGMDHRSFSTLNKATEYSGHKKKKHVVKSDNNDEDKDFNVDGSTRSAVKETTNQQVSNENIFKDYHEQHNQNKISPTFTLKDQHKRFPKKVTNKRKNKTEAHKPHETMKPSVQPNTRSHVVVAANPMVEGKIRRSRSVDKFEQLDVEKETDALELRNLTCEVVDEDTVRSENGKKNFGKYLICKIDENEAMAVEIEIEITGNHSSCKDVNDYNTFFVLFLMDVGLMTIVIGLLFFIYLDFDPCLKTGIYLAMAVLNLYLLYVFKGFRRNNNC